MTQTILLVEDEDIARKNLKHILTKEGYRVMDVDNGVKAVHLLETEPFDLVITDLKMKQVDGMAVLKRSKELQPLTEVIVITGYATVDSAVTALKDGAYHYIAKPYKNDAIRRIVKEALLKRSLIVENTELKDELRKSRADTEIIGKSPSMVDIKKMIAQIGATDVNVLILGESGTGKELVARAIHRASPRHDRRIVAFNCGSFTNELMANELFGHEQGAFTGAGKSTKGLLETADKGTVFLDEVGDMPLTMQVKLLRVIQEKEVIRVGGVNPIPLDIRFIAATHRSLQQEVANGTFRQDLFFRLNVVTMELPSLAERKGDIPLLAYHFLGVKNRAMNKSVHQIDREALDLLNNYAWPGNVRELENIIERAVALENSDTIRAASLPEYITGMSIEVYRRSSQTIPSLEDQEKNYMKWVLDKCMWNKTQAAKVMGIDRVSLWRKIKRYDLENHSI
ncbi:MAG: sigma-54-dependent Fis family transcriptional regulator [Desulfobacteraceae bacterium]|nr:MAG: sigma-54-dependent Fis family transcriptional regulator [Desulfobacteraceae bacterium]